MGRHGDRRETAGIAYPASKGKDDGCAAEPPGKGTMNSPEYNSAFGPIRLDHGLKEIK
jgi:hypothetical protein